MNPENIESENKYNQDFEEKDHIQEYSKLATEALAAKDYQQAQIYYQQILKLKSTFLTARLGLLEIAYHRGEHEKVLEIAEQLRGEGISNEKISYFRGKIYLFRKDYSNALKNLQEAFQFNPQNPVIAYSLGLSFLETNNLNRAGIFLEKAVELNPKELTYQFNLARNCFLLKNYTKAINHFQICVELFPKNASSLNALGSCYISTKEYDKAIAYLRQAIDLNSHELNCNYNLSLAYMELGHWQEAIEFAEKVCLYGPTSSNAFYLAGNIYYKIGKIEKAQEYYDKALTLEPAQPSFQFARSILDLLRGDLEHGLEGYELRCIAHPAFLKAPTCIYTKPWQGEDLNKKSLLILAEQGLGDNIQMIRYLDVLKEKYPTSHLIIEVYPPLKKLYEDTFCNSVQLIESHKEASAYDYSISIASLPYWCGTRLKTIPKKMPCIKVNKALIQQWEQRIAQTSQNKLKVGITWAGNPENPNDWKRSLDLTDIAPIFTVQGTTFYTLQLGNNSLQNFKETSPKEYSELNRHYGLDRIVDYTNLLIDVRETAALIQNLDIVICICSLVAHLSGSLNQKTWVLLSYAADWRWMLYTDTSAWYPSVKLFRQQQLFDWKPVIDEVKKQLHLLVKVGMI